MKKNINEPHVRRRGWLRNGNIPGDLSSVFRCLAKTRAKNQCQQPAMKNGRCRLHGGKSTGPKTPAGKTKSKMANWKHGFYSKSEQNLFREFKATLKQYKEELVK